MTILGTYPSDRYSISFMTQRLINKFPSWTSVRKNSFSIGQQFLNPIGEELEDTLQQLTIAKYNGFLSTIDMSLLSCLYRADLATGMSFNFTENSAGEIIYTPPTVYGTLDGTEYELTQAQYNDIQTLAYHNIPSRIEDGEEAYEYVSIFPETLVEDIDLIAPNDIVINSHIYVTLKNNTNWQIETLNKFYFPKIHITGITRKGTSTVEVIPFRYNGTFKSLNEWKSISEISVSYLDPEASVTIETFPWNADSLIDSLKLAISSEDERFQYLRLGSRSFGSTFIAETFGSSNMDMIRNLDLGEKNTFYELELLDSENNNITAVSFVQRPNTPFVYMVSSDKFYVYNVNIPYPDVTNLTDESSDSLIDIFSDKWIVARNETVTLKTRNLSEFDIPYKTRWKVLSPSGTQYLLGLDGTLSAYDEDTWIVNDFWDDGVWTSHVIDFTPTERGSYTISFESFYADDFNNTYILTSQYLIYVPSISPEIELDLPSSLENPINIGIDSDGNFWLLRYNGINKLNIFFDYYLVDYENNKVYLKENYDSVRIVI